MSSKFKIHTNQLFYYTCCIATPKSVTHVTMPNSVSLRLRTTQLLSKCCSGGELLVTLSPIRPARDLSFRPEMEQIRIFSTRPVNFKIYFLTGPVDRFFYRRFYTLLSASNEKFSNRRGGRGHG